MMNESIIKPGLPLDDRPWWNLDGILAIVTEPFSEAKEGKK
jgi:hypothetical protein